jgi:hypothetical protein
MLRAGYSLRHVRGEETLISWEFDNAITNQGFNRWFSNIDLGAAYGTTGGNTVAVWRQLLIDSVGYTAVSATDTYGEINDLNGWDEFTGYVDNSSVARRPSAFKSVVTTVTQPVWGNTNSGLDCPEFRINTSATLKGVALVGARAGQTTNLSTFGNTNAAAGTIFSIAEFPSDIAVLNGDVLFIKYTLSFAA